MQNNISLIRKEIIMDKINSRQFFGTLITACYQNAELRCVLCACSKCAPSHGALGYFIATNQMPCVVAPRRLRISAFCMLHGRSRIALKTQSRCDRGLISTKILDFFLLKKGILNVILYQELLTNVSSHFHKRIFTSLF